MKKLSILLLVCSLLSNLATAQEPEGNFSFDLNFNPAAVFDANAGSMFYFPQINGRYFLSSSTAIRLGLDIGYGSSKTFTNPDPDVDDYTKDVNSSFTIAPGYEKRFGAEKFFVFLGGELPISNYSTKRTTVVGDQTDEYDNVFGGYFTVGLNAVLGAEYYVFNSFYVGVLFSPGFQYQKTKDSKFNGEVTSKGGTSTSFNISSSSGLRVGFRF